MSLSTNKRNMNILIVDKSTFAFEQLLKDVEIIKANTVTYYSLTDYNNDKVNLSTLDMVVFTGGSDVNPELYSELTGKFTSVNKNRDKYEQRLFENLPKRVLKLGICRGAQFLNVMSGGSLIQHVNGHTSSHSISTAEGLNFDITSTHHQMMYPYDVNSHVLIAWSKYYKSETYLNGRNEEIDIPDNFLEPEIVHFTNTNSLCIQGHPEFDNCNKNTVKYCQDLVSNLLNSAK